MRWFVLVLFAGALTLPAWADAFAAPNCKNGVPCGNSCISKDKTCRK